MSNSIHGFSSGVGQVRGAIALVRIPEFDPSNSILPHQFVSSIFTIAAATLGSVHSFLGNTVQLSWNINTKVTQPEVKATRFMMMLKKDATSAGYCIAASAFSGMLSSLTVMAKKQSATLVTASWMPALRAAFDLACRYNALIVDANCFATAQYHFECRAVDVVCDSSPRGASSEDAESQWASAIKLFADGNDWPENSESSFGAPSHSLLYEVADEAQANEEWMYNVQATDVSANGVLNECMNCWLAAGERPTRLKLEADMGGKPGGKALLETPLVQRLVHRFT